MVMRAILEKSNGRKPLAVVNYLTVSYGNFRPLDKHIAIQMAVADENFAKTTHKLSVDWDAVPQLIAAMQKCYDDHINEK